MTTSDKRPYSCFHSMFVEECISCWDGALTRCNNELQTLIKGLQKAVKDDSTEWVDANIIRLLLDRSPSTRGSYQSDGTDGSV